MTGRDGAPGSATHAASPRPPRRARAPRAALAALAVVAALGLPSGASAQLRAFELRIDNDQFAFTPGTDERWYTSGGFFRFGFDAPAGAPDARVLAGFCARLASCDDGARVARVWTLGQRIYTPAFTGTAEAQPRDRPYAATLHVGWGVVSTGPRVRQALELQLGTLGPAALGEQTQNGLHRIIGQERALGWERQVRSQPLVQLGASRLDTWLPGRSVDAVTRVAALVGNPWTEASLGAIVRVGALPGLPTFPGEPTLAREAQGLYAFAGAQVRAVARDQTIEGATDAYVSRVVREPVVAELLAGASFGLAADWRVELAFALRQVDFSSPLGPSAIDRPQRIGTLVLRWLPARP